MNNSVIVFLYDMKPFKVTGLYDIISYKQNVSSTELHKILFLCSG